MKMLRNLLGLGVLLVASVAAADVDGMAIIREADLSRGNSEGVVWDVKVEEATGSKKTVGEYQVSGKGYNSLVEFTAPANTKGRKLLMVERNMWFIRPGLSRPVPISPRQRLLGSAANGDLASTNYGGAYVIEKMAEAKVGEKDCYLFDLKAATNNATYDRIRYWVAKDSTVGVKAEFLTSSGKLLKSATFEYDNQAEFQGKARKFISKMVIHDPAATDSVTTLTFRNVRATPVPDSKFNLNLIAR